MTGRYAWSALLAALLVGCQVPGLPPPRQLHPSSSLRDANRPAAQRREELPATEVAAEWSFSTAADECVATASGPPRTAALTVRVDRAVRLAVAPGAGASRLAFSGPGGAWTLGTAAKARDAAATLPLGNAAITRLLALLAGGKLKLEGGARPVTLVLPSAGVSGRDWIGCASGKVREAAAQ